MKHFSVILMLCLISITSTSQEINYGMYIGSSFSRWGDNAERFAQELSNELGLYLAHKARTGFTFGGFLEYGLDNLFSIRPELAYIQKGARFSGSGKFSGYYMNMDLIMQTDYLELPLLLKITPTNKEKILQAYLLAGPNIGYLITSKMKAKANADGESNTDIEDFKGVKKLDFGLNIGGGIKYKTVAFELRYQKGLQSILTNEASEGFDMKTSLFSINLIIYNY